MAEDDEWLDADVSGKYVYRDGAKGKFLEDHNVQSGVDVSIDAGKRWDDGSSFHLDGLGQSGEQQGFVRGVYDSLGSYDVLVDFSRWTEFYNDRDGQGRPSLFPMTNKGDVFYGDGLPSVDWLTTGAAFDLQGEEVLHDVYGDFHYRRVAGDESLLKGGTLDGAFVVGERILDPLDPLTVTEPGNPVTFGFPGRKDVRYEALMGMAGARSGLLGINWQTDVSYQYHDIRASTFEPSYCSPGTHIAAPCDTGGSLTSAERYKEDTNLKLVKYDITGSRNVSSDLFLFGAGFFSWERSDPEPDQFVFESVSGLTQRTRTTDSSKVTRLTPAASFGGVYRATRNLVVRADTQVRAHIQDADLQETRDESGLSTGGGDVGVVTHAGDRDAVVSTTRVQADWKVAPRVTVSGDARYQYRWDDINTRQGTSVFADPPEIEQYTQQVHRIDAGPSARVRLRRGRSIEGGYRFTYADVSQDIDRIVNQYNLGDYQQMRHRVYLKGGGRLAKMLRGEVRGQYIYEIRDLEGALAGDSLGDTTAFPSSGAKAEIQHWSVVPTLYFMPRDDWSFYGTYMIGQQKIEAKSGNTFDYETLTQSASVGGTYRPSDTWSASAAYTFYLNNVDTHNVGHNASLSGRIKLADFLGMNCGVRYLRFERDSHGLDDYDAVVVSLGLTASF